MREPNADSRGVEPRRSAEPVARSWTAEEARGEIDARDAVGAITAGAQIAEVVAMSQCVSTASGLNVELPKTGMTLAVVSDDHLHILGSKRDEPAQRDSGAAGACLTYKTCGPKDLKFRRWLFLTVG